ncbi:MAG: hypothetical protein GC191_14670 [Azospirillum sp.]|nr:hypothetical protein [Azospirillum sp.]
MPAAHDTTNADDDDTLGLDDAGWAWEFLRRNLEYGTDYQRCHQAEQAGAPDAARMTEGASQRWGLRFPARSGAQRC